MSAVTSPLRAPARRTGLWVAAILACAALFIVIYEYFVRSSSGQLVDTVARLNAEYYDHPLPYLDPANPWIAFYIVAPPALVFLGITLTRQKFVSALIAVGTVIGANLSTQVFKSTLYERPELGDFPTAWTQDYLDNSLPSGHTTIAASVAVAVFLVGSPRQRPFLGVLAALWGGGWGTYIFIDNWHRPSDMVAAYLVVAIWALIGGWLIMRLEPRKNSVYYDALPPVAPAAAFCWFFGIVFTLAAGLCLLFAGGWSGIARAAEDPSLWMWLAGALLSLGPAFLVAGAGINFFGAEAGRLQRGMDLPSPQAERISYPVPPQFNDLYRV
ncbi:phosphatase PAP2 family protein [Nesterenkonia flava]|uniref:Phosphatase PAP2 family protein n=1 Tax=Nesterenkonia flava TaxID=469799 RepID=A0ABU1FR97_9MICC|nr:phosphatase PAP2 family protein [Nesterenkonia flava]MDR5711175.1 phosphatase PAP2 family protein [Nesterenkonia flava]